MTSFSTLVVELPWHNGNDALVYGCSHDSHSPLKFITLFHSGLSADVGRSTFILLLLFFSMECIVLILFPMILTPAARERDKAQKAAAQKKPSHTPSTSGYSTPTSWAMSPIGTPAKSSKKGGASSQPSRRSGTSTPARANSGGLDHMLLDLSAANLQPREDDSPRLEEPPPRVAIEREKLLEEARRELQASGQGAKKGVSLVVIGKLKDMVGSLRTLLLFKGMLTPASQH